MPELQKNGRNYSVRPKNNTSEFGETWTDLEKDFLKTVGLDENLMASDLKDDHLSILLSSYEGTLRQNDVICLQILNKIERQGVLDYFKYAPFAFGPYGRKCYENLKSFGDRLWKRPSYDDILRYNINRGLMLESSQNMPLHLKLDFTGSEQDDDKFSRFYDPRFFLPLFNSFFNSDSLIDFKLFIETNCFYFSLACLCCHDDKIRKCAYIVLFKFRKFLSSYTTNSEEKTLILNLLNIFRRSLIKNNQRLSSILAVFLAKATNILLNPLDPMYVLINSFILLKPTLDLDNIPEFYKFFNSSSDDFSSERQWILQLMCDGLREAKDFRIFERRFAFKFLFSFWNSTLCDEKCRKLIAQIILSTCKIQSALVELCSAHNLMAWVNSCIISNRIDRNTQNFGHLVEFTLAIYENLVGHKNWDTFLKMMWVSCACACLRELKNSDRKNMIEENTCKKLTKAVRRSMRDEEKIEAKRLKRCVKFWTAEDEES